MTIAVDFDGTIVTHAYPAIGKELPGAIDTLKRLQSEGHRLILWTVREGKLLDEAVEYCRNRGLEFFSVNENYTGEIPQTPDGERMACRKLNADIYIDDRNLGGFSGWEAICRMLTERMNYSQYYAYLTKGADPVKRPSIWKRFFD